MLKHVSLRRSRPISLFEGWVLVVGLFAGLAPVALGDTYTFTTIDDPAALPGITYALGLNNAGQIVGYYYDAAGYHGFLYSGGVFTPINAPSAPNSTVAIGINNLGQIVGYYTMELASTASWIMAGSSPLLTSHRACRVLLTGSMMQAKSLAYTPTEA